jgi:hypothetical protein
MKSIIINKNRWIRKNNKRHCLYYSYSWQESIWHDKRCTYRFEGKEHHYYKKLYSFYWFNDKDFYL